MAKNQDGTVNAGAVACAVENDCVSGSFYFQVVSDTGVDEAGFSADMRQALVNLVPGQTYSFSMSTKGIGGQYAFYNNVIFFDDNGSANWQTRTGTFVAVQNPTFPFGFTAYAFGGEAINVKFDNVVITAV